MSASELKQQTLKAAQQGRETRALTHALDEVISRVPQLVGQAAVEGKTEAAVYGIKTSEVNFPREYYDRQPLPPDCLKGLAKAVFDRLAEAELSPRIDVPSASVFVIMVPVPAV